MATVVGLTLVIFILISVALKMFAALLVAREKAFKHAAASIGCLKPEFRLNVLQVCYTLGVHFTRSQLS